MSLNWRTVVSSAFVAIIIILTMFLSTVIGKQSTKSIEVSTGSSLADLAYQLSDRLDHFIWSRVGEVEMLSKLNAFQEPIDNEEINGLLNQLKGSFPVFTWVGYMDVKGNVISSTNNGLLNNNMSQQNVFQERLKGPYSGEVLDEVLMSKLLPDRNGETLQFVDISVPVYGQQGQITGVLVAYLSSEWTREVERSMLVPLEKRVEGLEVFVVRQKDRTILLGPANRMNQQLTKDTLMRVAPGKSSWSVEKDFDNNAYLTGYAYGDGYLNYPGLGWSVIIRQPADEAFAPITQLKEIIVLFVLVTSVLFGIMGWFLARWFTRPYDHRSTTLELSSSSVDVDILTHDYMSDKALHDVLTGLPNRVAVDDFLIHAVNEANLKRTTLSFLHLALDGLEQVNDAMGHASGDKLLQKVAFRLQDCTREQEIVARLGGNEFVVILKTSANKPMQDAEVVAKRIINIINLPFVIDGKNVQIGCSVGAAVWSSEVSDPNETLRLANEALYISKRSGKNQITFETAS